MVVVDEDEYYLAIGSEPPFAYYRHVRIEQCTDEWKKLTMEAAIDSITQDELDFFLKSKLRMTPEERYQARKGNCCWHESGWSHRRLDAYDGQGCNQFTGCIPECRFYPQYGRIEDEEVIKENRQAEEYYRKRNMIVNIDIAANYNDYQEYLKM
jgi:hypothetical protein